MILAVTGGRRYAWQKDDTEILIGLFHYLGTEELWHGGASGVDEHAARIARLHHLSVRVFLPEPVLFEDDRTRALLGRSELMIRELDLAFQGGAVVGVAAFAGGTGTQYTVGQTLRRRIPLIDLRHRRISTA